MAIGAMTMLLTNVGLNIFNNWANIRKNDSVRKLNEEYQKAIQNEQSDRVFELLKKGQNATLEIEQEQHRQRLSLIKEEFSQLLDQQAYAMALNDWPLKVSPLVMKHQTLGHFLYPEANAENNPIALHCILAPSNSDSFNKYVFPLLSNALDSYCNLNWLSRSDHPVLFYSGAWKDTSSSISNNGNVMSNLKTILGNLPVLVITPTFNKETHKFSVLLASWGLGANVNQTDFTDPLYMPFQEIHPDELPNQDYDDRTEFEKNPELVKNCLEDLVPYFETIIGYIADSYFWAAYSKAPLLPNLLKSNTIDTDGANYLLFDSRKYYSTLLCSTEGNSSDFPFTSVRQLTFLEGISPLWDDEENKSRLEELFLKYCNNTLRRNFSNINDALDADLFAIHDLPFLEEFSNLYEGDLTQLRIVINKLSLVNFDYRILLSTDISFLQSLVDNCADTAAMYRLGEIYEYSIGVKHNRELSEKFYNQACRSGFVLAVCNQFPSAFKQYEDSIGYLQRANVVQAWVVAAKYSIHETARFTADNIPTGMFNSHPFLKYQTAKTLIDSNNNLSYAEQILSETAESGYVAAQELICKLHKDGVAFKDNNVVYAHFAELGMLQNSAECTFTLAMCYLNGQGVQQSTNTAIMLIDRAASELGHPEAQRISKLLKAI